MSTHVLLNLLKELGKRDKMQGVPSILSLFRNEFNKFNKTRARMLRLSSTDMINRGPCMSTHVLLNLLKELGKRDKMQGVPSILSLFRNEFNKFNKTRARMLRLSSTEIVNRGPCMSAHVLFNLLKELGKRDKMQGVPSIFSLFRNEFNKFNKTRA